MSKRLTIQNENGKLAIKFDCQPSPHQQHSPTNNTNQ